MASKNPVVRVKQGQLRGVVADNVYGGQFLAFRGVPYAKPPVGPLRFKDPVPPEPWTGIRDATKFGDECAQIDWVTDKFIGSDDCLYLNIYRPVHDSPKRAVMMWIHGGGFINGSGSDREFGPDYLVRKDVILVTINYRLGIFGFLCLEHELAPGNQGLKDQVMALKWIQENISNFGGDPNNVTIFGESAGAGSVHYLTISPLADGLFHRAIAQSGVVANPWAVRSVEPSKYAYQLAAHLGEHSKDPATVLEFFRTCEPSKLVLPEKELITDEMRHTVLGLFIPCVDDKSPNPFLPQHPSILMQSGAKVPFMLGYTKNEGNVMIYWLSTANPINGIVAPDYQKINEKFEMIIPPDILLSMKKDGITPDDVKRIYFGNEPVSEKLVQKYADLLGDILINQGTYDVLKILSEKSTQPTYFYIQTYDTEDSMTKTFLKVSVPGPTHGDDLIYLFYSKVAEEFGQLPPQPGTEKYKMMECFTQLWTDFAKTGNPTPKVTDLIPTVWKPVEKGNGYNYLDIGIKLQMKNDNEDRQRCDWKKMKNKLQ